MFNGKKIKRVVVFVSKINNKYYLEGKKSLQNDSPIVKFRNNKTFTLNFKECLYASGTTFYYFIDIKKNEQLHFDSQTDPNLSSEEVDLLFSSKILKEITLGLKDKSTKFNWSTFIFGCFAGALIGLVLAFLYFQEQLSKVGNTPVFPGF